MHRAPLGASGGRPLKSQEGRPRAVIFHATSVPVGWRRVLADTARARLHFTESWFPRAWRGSARVRFFLGDEYESLSYIADWREAWSRAPRLDSWLIDVNDAVAMTSARRRVREADLVVILHSAAGDDLTRIRKLERALQMRRSPLLILFGNEYARMREKIAFAQAVEAEFIGSQLTPEAGRWLYAETRAKVLHLPQALNPRVYRPLGVPRNFDLGFRGDRYDHPFALGDLDRYSAIEHFRQSGEQLGLRTDIEYGRVEREVWNQLLNRWRGIVGAESGTRYLERDDRTREAVIEYLRAYPHASWPVVFERFFAQLRPEVSGKAISSRHFEPLGTGTVQVLVEGRYNDILKPDVHYMALRPDLSNATDLARRLKDRDEVREISARGRELALSAHTYEHRVEEALTAIFG